MARYAIVDEQGNVDNIIEWDGSTPFDPGTGYTIRKAVKADRLVAVPDQASTATLHQQLADYLASPTPTPVQNVKAIRALVQLALQLP